MILIGGTGNGNTHLAIVPGVAAIHHGKRIRVYNAVDLVNLLKREKAQGKAGNLPDQYSTPIDTPGRFTRFVRPVEKRRVAAGR